MSNTELTKIRDFIKAYFSWDDLDVFCFDFFPQIGNDYSQSPIRLERWAHELVKYCKQTRQLDKLKRCLELRRPEAYLKEFAHPNEDRSIAIFRPIRIEFMHIPAGEFLMGSDSKRDPWASVNEQPQHRVFLAEFFISKFPITSEQFGRYTYDNFSTYPVRIIGGDENPVANVSWYEARDFCEWLRSTTGKEIRLPTEAEWEKAARGVDGLTYPWGDEFDSGNLNSLESRFWSRTAVTEYRNRGMSSYGVVDMVGNVREWCLDHYDSKAYQQKERRRVPQNPTGPSEGIYRVLRGGSFRTNEFNSRCASRASALPTTRMDDIGFRVVLVPEA
jgi:formylglycine-generating enzyme required for sulfatase activity